MMAPFPPRAEYHANHQSSGTSFPVSDKERRLLEQGKYRESDKPIVSIHPLFQ